MRIMQTNEIMTQEWNRPVLMIQGNALKELLKRNTLRAKLARHLLTRGFEPKKKKQSWRFWTHKKVQDLCAWIAFAALFTGVAFIAASVFDGARKVHEDKVWTQTARGLYVPMKEKHAGERK